MRDEVLRLLKSRKTGHLSGEELAESLQVSRAAVWKAIESLRKDGYEIDAVTAKGYRLVGIPDRLLPEEIIPQLKTRSFGRKIHYFPATTSTNDEAIRRAKEGGEEGEVFIAEQQTAGRGRMGRPWESTEAKNLMISFLLKPKLPPQEAVLLTLVAGAATLEAISAMAPPATSDLKIKWPNDLYLKDRKMGGVLTEMESAVADQVHWVVCGIGIDLNAEPSDFSPEVGRIATSLRIATGKKVDRLEVTRRLVEAFEKRYLLFCKEGPADLIDFCNRHSYLKGKRVRLEGGPGGLRGIAGEMTPEGFLRIQTDAGEVKTVTAGDVMPENG